MSQKQKIITPCNGEVIAEVNLSSVADIEQAIAAARNAFDNGPWPRLTFSERKQILLKISQGILDRAAELSKIESLNTGKPIKETTFMDIPSSAKAFGFLADNFEKYLNEEVLNLENAQSHLFREPQGVVVLIVPWNYPLLIASWKLASALAAGNSIILKPSSLTPLTALELDKIIREAGLPEGVFNLLIASGKEIGQKLCADKRVDMISFTGSNEVGREILSYAASNVKKLIMELGGKSASIILKDADLELAVNGSLCSIFLNQGQMCTAMSRIFVEDDIYDAFISSFTDKAKRIKLGDSLDYQTQMGPLISDAQRKRAMEFVKEAQKEGAKLLCGGKVPADPALKKGFYFEPTVFSEVQPQMSIFRKEVFGPVTCVMRFSDVDEAINLANQSDFALAGAIWTKNLNLAQNLASQINAGVVWINTYGMFYNELPYGGFKQSGFGKELGKEGFLEYTRLKNIFVDQTKGSQPLVNYWYGF
ncbi:MAG: aldehyde dehydrogenase family protein [Candidatus Omnitrophota bacterium]